MSVSDLWWTDETTQHFPLPLNSLVAGWVVARVHDVALEIGSGFACGEHTSDRQGVAHMRPMNISRNGEIDLALVKSVPNSRGVLLRTQDVLFNNTNSPELVGKTALVGQSAGGFAFSNHMTRIHVAEGVEPAFVAAQLHFLWMSGYFRHRCANHVNQASVSTRMLADSVPLLVAPRHEQLRIVEKLEELLPDLDAGVAELRAAQAKLKLYRQSLLNAAVIGELTAEWRKGARAALPAEAGAALLANILVERRNRWRANEMERFAQRGKQPALNWQGKYPEPIAADADELPALPRGWVWTTLDALIVDGPQNGVYLPGHLYGSGHPILRIDDFQNDWLRPRDQLNLVDADAATHRIYSLVPGDLVINRVNSMTHLGKCVSVGSQLAGVLFESNMMRMHLATRVSSRFVEMYLQSSVGHTRLIGGAKWAVNQASINQKDVKRTPIPLPPWAEQLEIVEVVESQLASATERNADIGHSLRQSEAQRKNILKCAFSGQLVPQDPNDEPASVLLERIRASRADKASAPTRRPRKAKELA
jgi:type I restriction enzyme, S subunit